MADEIVDALGKSPFDGREFRWRMGVKALDSAGWLQIDPHRDSDLAEKKTLLIGRFGDVAAFSEASYQAETEVLDLVVDALATNDISLDRGIESHPLVTAGRNIQEDLCLLEKRPTGWVLTGGVVCFPTRWSLSEKIGRPIGEIHGPVPGIEAISTTIDRFFDRMKPGSIVSRSNWSLTDDGSLRLEPTLGQSATAMPADPARGLCLRVERQTLRKLTTENAICFTIKIHRWALGEVVDQLPPAALSAALAGMPADIARYKDIDGYRDDLITWLSTKSRR